MGQSNLNYKFQQTSLYIFVAVMIPVSAYIGLIYDLSVQSQSNLNLAELLKEQPFVWLVLIVPIALLVSGVISLLQPRLGAKIALISSIVGFCGFLIASCVIFLTISILLVLLPRAFIAFVLPTLLLCITIAYSRWVLKTDQQNATVLFWLFSQQGAGVLSKSLVAIVVALCILQISIQVFLQQNANQSEVYRMSWENEPHGECKYQVALRFVDAYGYQILACSKELAEYLEKSPNDEVDVVIARRYSIGTWMYEIKQVGGWHGPARYYGLSFSCSSNDPKCEDKSSEPPLHQPYFIIEEPRFE